MTSGISAAIERYTREREATVARITDTRNVLEQLLVNMHRLDGAIAALCEAEASPSPMVDRIEGVPSGEIDEMGGEPR